MDDAATLLALAASPGPDWASRVRALPGDARATLRRSALALLPHDVARARRVAGVLADEFDLSDPDEAASLVWLLASVATEPALETLFRRAANGAADADLALESALLCGQLEVVRGHHDAAEERYRDVLARARGTRRRAERVAFLAYARLCLQSRRDFEALVLARRARCVMDAAGDLWGSVLSRLHETAVLADFRDWERLDAGLATIAPLAASLPSRQRLLVESSVHARRAQRAIELRRPEEALAEVDETQRKAEIAAGNDHDPRTVALLRMRAHLAAGRPLDALACGHDAASRGPRDDRLGLSIEAAALQARVRTREVDVGPLVEAFLAVLTTPGARRLGPGVRLAWAHAIADDMRSVPELGPTTRRAYDVAASACIERVQELDRFVDEMPEIARASPDEVEILADHRRRTIDERREVHRAVARMIARSARQGASPLPMLSGDGGMICVCAWCGRVRRRGGEWMALHAILPVDAGGPLPLTHGICETCAPRLQAEIDATAPSIA
jgi:hypothetical protein